MGRRSAAYACAVSDGRSRGRAKFELPLQPSPPDLPEVLPLAHAAPVELRGVEVRERHLSAFDLSGRDATSLQLLESRVEGVDLSGAALRGATIRDTVVEGGDWANADASEAALTRIQMRSVRLTGSVFAQAKIRDATFVECRVDLASFRFGELERVRFENCRMEEVDFYEARLSSVAFLSCDLTKANLAKARFVRSEMRDCELDGIGDPERLAGVAMPWVDIVRSAAVLAEGVGVHVLSED